MSLFIVKNPWNDMLGKEIPTGSLIAQLRFTGWDGVLPVSVFGLAKAHF